MSAAPARSRRVRRLGPPAVAGLAVAVAVSLAGCGGGAWAEPGGAAPARPAAPGGATAAAGGLDGFRAVRTYDEPAPPERVRIPALGVDSALERLGRLPDGTIAAPRAWERAGWYAQGPRPGQRGPAVVLGHVDSTSGPAVFYRLATLRPGDEVLVDLADRGTLVFRVDRTARYPKDRFPTEAVYFPTLDRVLRLVTCGGTFDPATGHYRDNVVVYASLPDGG